MERFMQRLRTVGWFAVATGAAGLAAIVWMTATAPAEAEIIMFGVVLALLVRATVVAAGAVLLGGSSKWSRPALMYVGVIAAMIAAGLPRHLYQSIELPGFATGWVLAGESLVALGLLVAGLRAVDWSEAAGGDGISRWGTAVGALVLAAAAMFPTTVAVEPGTGSLVEGQRISLLQAPWAASATTVLSILVLAAAAWAATTATDRDHRLGLTAGLIAVHIPAVAALAGPSSTGTQDIALGVGWWLVAVALVILVVTLMVELGRSAPSRGPSNDARVTP